MGSVCHFTMDSGFIYANPGVRELLKKGLTKAPSALLLTSSFDVEHVPVLSDFFSANNDD